MAANKTGMLLRKAKYIQQREGLPTLMRRASLFFLRSIFDHQTYYIYENTSDGNTEAKPNVANLTFRVISTLEELDELIAEDFNFYPYLNMHFDFDISEIKNRINQGATLFCTFVGKEIASVLWLALTEEAKQEIDIVPYPIDFKAEACLGDGQTVPKYRRLGIYTYCVSQICQFAHNKRLKLRFTIPHGIIAIFKVHTHVGSNSLGEISYWKFLAWETWKEKPVRQNPRAVER